MEIPMYNLRKNYLDIRILDETEKYVVGHIFEDAYVIEKSTGAEIVHDDFYGDPSCALISRNNDWAIIAGEHLTIWTKGSITRIENPELQWICAVRTNDDRTVEILIDPWSDKASIWALDIATLQVEKIRDFFDYREKEYTDAVTW